MAPTVARKPLSLLDDELKFFSRKKHRYFSYSLYSMVSVNSFLQEDRAFTAGVTALLHL